MRDPFIRRYLDPAESLAEVIFGLIMTLTFTLGASVTLKKLELTQKDLIWGVVGCNIAWGLIDGGLYILTSLYDRSHKLRLMSQVARASDMKSALEAVGHQLDDRIGSVLAPGEREQLYTTLVHALKNAELPTNRLKVEDIWGAVASFWLVFLSNVPVVLPFVLIRTPWLAVRVSNALLLLMLFFVGYRWAKEIHLRPWVAGCVTMLVGLSMVTVAILLGG